MNIAFVGKSPSEIDRFPEVTITDTAGHRDQIISASSKPSKLPGIQTSVMTKAIGERPSSTERASSALAHAITDTPSSEIASAVNMRRISSPSTNNTVDMVIVREIVKSLGAEEEYRFPSTDRRHLVKIFAMAWMFAGAWNDGVEVRKHLTRHLKTKVDSEGIFSIFRLPFGSTWEKQ